jgi:CBS domain-containing protein
MKAADVMVSNVITVAPDANVADVAQILLNNRISAVPVVDQHGELKGIVSEGDLLHRVEAGTERHRSWWLEFMTAKQTLANEFVKSHSRKVSDVMTRRVVTAAPDTPLDEVAGLLERNAIKRVPIVKDKKVVGIVSRANLLQALATLGKEPVKAPIDDSALRAKVMAELRSKPWTRPSLLNAIVRDGVVDLWGVVDSQTEKNAVRVAAEVVPGVRSVNDNLIIQPITAGT